MALRTRRQGYSSPRVAMEHRLSTKIRESETSGWIWVCGCFAIFAIFVTPVILLEAGLEALDKQHKSDVYVPNMEEFIPHDPGDSTRYHVVFSTDCSEYHNFQSYILFYFMEKIQQPGTVTRIASGCTAKQQMMLEDYQLQHIHPISHRFKIHFTPSYMRVGGDLYPYYNKPFGVRHWMEHSLGFPHHQDDDDAVIILLDPDMIPLRPLTRYFENDTDMWASLLPSSPSPQQQKQLRLQDEVKEYHDKQEEEVRWVLDHGYPFAQQYMLAPIWLSWNLTDLVGPDSPAHRLTQEEALKHYQVGPPYLATAHDMWKIVTRWTELCIKVKESFPSLLLADLYAYLLAIADLEMPHQASVSMTWSDARIHYSEPWEWVEELEAEDLCRPRLPNKLANFLHYSQPHSFLDFMFSKQHIRHKIHRCDHPLMEEPPLDLAVGHDLSQVHGRNMEFTPEELWAERVNKREAFMTCHMICLVNEAMEHHRRHVCPKGSGNVNRTFRITDEKGEESGKG